ncbi:VWA domain-containing protein [Roseiconus nitratireducens]|uniref:VWA domain-containing protein n=1 Tax=Roseiconus nitratireducens TaxID=2605748 RepID=A0A5M6DPB6_9BACT|nr:VWA domain-containing protein [Roseiconus nitratireducens]KAA5547285.1 VWA domain-containing protein [Roseiconus nitratireducens]
MLVFEFPWVFLLLPLPWVLRAVLPARQRQRVAVRVPFGDRIAQAQGGKRSSRPLNRVSHRRWLPALLWLLVLTSLARPQRIQPPLTKEFPTRDLLLLVDLSSSMQQEDFTNAAGQKVDRLAAVKEVLGDFLVKRDGDRVGLVVFGDAPYLQAPFSTDLQLSRRLLDECQVGMAGPRTSLGDAIGLGVNLFDQSDAPAKTIIALTDGNDTKSQVPPVEAARVANQRDIHIYTVAIGDPTTVGEDKLDEQTLRDVAEAADGDYFFAGDRDTLQGIYDKLDQIETRQIKTASYRPRNDLFYVPLAAGLLLSLVGRAISIVASHSDQKRESVRQRQTVEVNPITGELEVSG